MEGWGNLLVAVKPYNHSVEAFLRSARAKTVDKGVLTIEVYYPFHKDKLEEPKNREIVEMGIKKVFGIETSLRCVLAKNKTKPLMIMNDTPLEKVSEELKNDIYDVAKEIFG
jgi:DNA polymerase-3 subunit gamma/tau